MLSLQKTIHRGSRGGVIFKGRNEQEIRPFQVWFRGKTKVMRPRGVEAAKTERKKKKPDREINKGG